MKSKFYFKGLFFFLFSFSLMTLSCSSDDNGGSIGSDNTISARIDGVHFQSEPHLTNVIRETLPEDGVESFIISGTDENQNSIIMFLFFDGPGTYPIGGDFDFINSIAYVVKDPDNPNGFTTWETSYDFLEYGQVKVTEFSENRLRGTFHTSVINEDDWTFKDIESGAFNIKLNTAP